MLRHLHIRNYALISALDIDFGSGFSVLTGETGAGKSIILGALGLIMGNRADSKSITEGEEKCVIEAEFDPNGKSGESVAAFFKANDLDEQPVCLIRREVSVNGKSRAFVNDTPVALNILRELTDMLIDIHSQHENLLLRDDTFMLGIADVLAGNNKERDSYIDTYRRYTTMRQQLYALQQRAAKAQSEADYIAFQHKQLSEARLQADEETELGQELQRLNHTEDIKSGLGLATHLLEDENGGILAALKEAQSSLRHICGYLPEGDNMVERLQSTYIELKDIADEASRIDERTDFDPERLQQAEERMDLLNTLMQKHRKSSVNELISLRDDLAEQLKQSESVDEDIAALQHELKLQQQRMQAAADALSQSRAAVCAPASAMLADLLTRLGIAHARVQMEVTPLGECTETGQDNVQLLFAANKNQSLRAVAEVASGGETARLMLCIKMLTAEQTGLPTLIFDEVDTGVSGEAASNMGDMMRQLGENRQVLAITHLPQIAAKGTIHYKVYKADNESRTETHILRLGDEERVREIATLLSGENITEAALSNARELLRTR